MLNNEGCLKVRNWNNAKHLQLPLKMHAAPKHTWWVQAKYMYSTCTLYVATGRGKLQQSHKTPSIPRTMRMMHVPTVHVQIHMYLYVCSSVGSSVVVCSSVGSSDLA